MSLTLIYITSYTIVDSSKRGKRTILINHKPQIMMDLDPLGFECPLSVPGNFSSSFQNAYAEERRTLKQRFA